MDEAERPSGVKVVDRRRFTESGEVRSDAPPAAEARETSSPDPEATSSHEAPGGDFPPADFSLFVHSLALQAMAFLGELPDPQSGVVTVDVNAAKYHIDLLGLLHEKTKGNLRPDEQQFLDEALKVVRLAFVAKTTGA